MAEYGSAADARHYRRGDLFRLTAEILVRLPGVRSLGKDKKNMADVALLYQNDVFIVLRGLSLANNIL